MLSVRTFCDIEIERTLDQIQIDLTKLDQGFKFVTKKESHDLCLQMINEKNIFRIFDIFSELHNNNKKPDCNMLHEFIDKLGPRYHYAEEIYSILCQAQIDKEASKARVFFARVRANIMTRDEAIAEGKKIVHNFKSFELQAVSCMIKAYGCLKYFEGVQEMFEWGISKLSKYYAPFYMNYIYALANCSRLDAIYSLFAYLKKHNQLTAEICSSTLRPTEDPIDLSKKIELYFVFLEKGLVNFHSHNHMLASAEEAADYPLAKTVYHHANERKELNENTLAHIIRMAGSCGDIDFANQVYDDAKIHNLQTSLVYTVTLTANVRCKNFTKAEFLFDNPPKTYTYIIRAPQAQSDGAKLNLSGSTYGQTYIYIQRLLKKTPTFLARMSPLRIKLPSTYNKYTIQNTIEDAVKGAIADAKISATLNIDNDGRELICKFSFTPEFRIAASEHSFQRRDTDKRPGPEAANPRPSKFMK